MFNTFFKTLNMPLTENKLFRKSKKLLKKSRKIVKGLLKNKTAKKYGGYRNKSGETPKSVRKSKKSKKSKK